MCNCKATEIVVALVILAASFIVIPYAQWVIVVAAAVLLIHGLRCKDIACCKTDAKPKAKRKR